MRRIGRVARTLTLALLASLPAWARSDEPPKADPAAVDRVLAEWERKASTIQSVEVRFSSETIAGATETIRREGRAVLAAPNLALLETGPVGSDGKLVELEDRIIWNGRSIVRFDLDQREATRFHIQNEWPAPPEPLRLPFFFGMTAEGAKRDYDWAVFREDQDRIILAARPKLVRDVARFVIVLDPKTFLPSLFSSYAAKGSGRVTYKSLGIKVNESADVDSLKSPCLDAWNVTERDDWLTRLFLK